MADNLEVPVGAGVGTAFALAFGGKDLMVKFLGPTAEYYGGEVRKLNEKGFENFKRIIRIAVHKAGSALETPGAVPPRVVHKIMEEGFFVEDALAAEYFGGVLASSRVSDSRDDRAASWVNVLTRLTTYQLRAHYVFYMSLRDVLVSHPEHAKLNEHIGAIRTASRTLIFNKDSIAAAMEISSTEIVDIMEHIEHGLKREDLIESIEVAQSARHELRVTPTVHGISLLLWANAQGKTPASAFTSVELQREPGINIPEAHIVKAVTRTGAAVWM